MQASRFEAGADFRVVAMASKFRACVTTDLDATALNRRARRHQS